MGVVKRLEHQVLGEDTGKAGGSASRRRLLRESVGFAVVGAASTLAFLALYVVLRSWIDATWANVVGLLVTTIANTAANRRLTFGVRGRDAVVRHQLQGLFVFGIALALSTGALHLLHAVDPTPIRPVEVSALLVANALSTLLRFLALRTWIFRPRGESRPRRRTDSKRQGLAGPSHAARQADLI